VLEVARGEAARVMRLKVVRSQRRELMLQPHLVWHCSLRLSVLLQIKNYFGCCAVGVLPHQYTWC
jgi:hypothetical protein